MKEKKVLKTNEVVGSRSGHRGIGVSECASAETIVAPKLLSHVQGETQGGASAMSM